MVGGVISSLVVYPKAASEEIWKPKKEEGETSRGNDVAMLGISTKW